MVQAIRNPNTQGPLGSQLLHSGPRDDHLEQLLDEALKETFPASDPIAVTPPEYR